MRGPRSKILRRIREMGLCGSGKARTVYLRRRHSGAWTTRHDREEQCRARTRPAGPATSRPALRAGARRAACGVSPRVPVPRRRPRRSCRLTTASSRQAAPDIAGAAFFLCGNAPGRGALIVLPFCSLRRRRAFVVRLRGKALPSWSNGHDAALRKRRRGFDSLRGHLDASRPVCSTLRSTSARSSADRAPASGAGRRGFESSRAHRVPRLRGEVHPAFPAECCVESRQRRTETLRTLRPRVAAASSSGSSSAIAS